MADTNTATEAPAKKKRASFTRTAKPIYAIVQRVLDDGSLEAVDPSGFKFTFERDTDKLLAIVSETGAKPLKIELPTAAKPAAKA